VFKINHEIIFQLL